MKFSSPEAAVAWLAGLLEGEGCFSRPSKHHSARIKLVMTDQDVVETAAKIIPPSATRSYKGRRFDALCKQVYEADWCGNNAVFLMRQVLPYMHSRRAAKIEELLEITSHRPEWIKNLPMPEVSIV